MYLCISLHVQTSSSSQKSLLYFFLSLVLYIHHLALKRTLVSSFELCMYAHCTSSRSEGTSFTSDSLKVFFQGVQLGAFAKFSRAAKNPPPLEAGTE